MFIDYLNRNRFAMCFINALLGVGTPIIGGLWVAVFVDCFPANRKPGAIPATSFVISLFWVKKRLTFLVVCRIMFVIVEFNWNAVVLQ